MADIKKLLEIINIFHVYFIYNLSKLNVKEEKDHFLVDSQIIFFVYFYQEYPLILEFLRISYLLKLIC